MEQQRPKEDVVKRLLIAVIAGVLMTGTAAIAASTPTATTGASSNVTASGATVAATVNPNGTSTTYAFQYGTTTNYGSQTQTTSAGAGTSSETVHATLSALASHTTYHYRVVATSASGTTSGSDQTFTTTAVPPSVSTSSPSLVTSSSATLAGSVNPRGKSTVYSFQYGPTASYGLQTAATSAGSGTSTTTVHGSLSNLTSGTTYHYRLVAINADGTSASSDATFTTTGPSSSPNGTLPAVSQAGAVKVTANSAQLNGAVNPEGPTTTWYFEYGLSGYYGLQTAPQTISGFGARAVNAQLTGLAPNSTYHFRLVAYSANGLYVGTDKTFTTKNAARVHPQSFALYSRTQHYRSGVTLVTSGTLRLPGSINRLLGCNGAVAVQVERYGSTVELKRAFVRSNCTYTMRIYVSNGTLRHATRLTLVARFEGNQFLMPTTTRRSVRA
jgi:hypothetical protein